MRIGYLGPEGTFTQAAALTAPAAGELELIAQETIHDTVLAVRDGKVDRALVPIENSLEGSVNVTLDALVLDADSVRMVGETVLAVEQCLIVQEALPLEEIEVVISHPQATAQCRGYIRSRMPEARVMTSSSTAEAVRLVSERIRHRWAAIGTRLAAELYDCIVLEAGIEDVTGNETRFVWLAREGEEAGVPGAVVADDTPWKTAIVFWGEGTESPGWLVSCLSEFAFRGVNMNRIESRPLRAGLGSYMFFVDLDGRASDRNVAEALAGLSDRANVLRTLGSFPVASATV
jgi:prephenate dehydratase